MYCREYIQNHEDDPEAKTLVAKAARLMGATHIYIHDDMKAALKCYEYVIARYQDSDCLESSDEVIKAFLDKNYCLSRLENRQESFKCRGEAINLLRNSPYPTIQIKVILLYVERIEHFNNQSDIETARQLMSELKTQFQDSPHKETQRELDLALTYLQLKMKPI